MSTFFVLQYLDTLKGNRNTQCFVMIRAVWFITFANFQKIEIVYSTAFGIQNVLCSVAAVIDVCFDGLSCPHFTFTINKIIQLESSFFW